MMTTNSVDRRRSSMEGVFENDALTLEYKLYERDTLRHLDVADFVNNAAGLGLGGPEEGGLQEKLIDFAGPNFSPPGDNVGD